MSQQNASGSLPPSGAPRLYLREDELDLGIAHILDAASAIKRAGADSRETAGLSWADTRVLSACGRTPQPVLALATRLAITKQALAKTLENLEIKGLIKRSLDLKDKRKRIVELTAIGAQLEHQLSERARNKLAQAYRIAGGEAVAGSEIVLRALLEQKT